MVVAVLLMPWHGRFIFTSGLLYAVAIADASTDDDDDDDIYGNDNNNKYNNRFT